MRLQTLQLLRILANPGVTRTPRRVLGELRRRGKPRLPAKIERGLGGTLPQSNALAFVRRLLDGEMITRHEGRWVLNSFLPPFPSRAYDRMFDNLLSGRRLSPVSSFLAVTASCPYHCWHCSLKQRETGELSTHAWCRVIHQLHNLGTSIIGFTGGEPLVRDDLPSLVSTARDGGAETIVFTSGALIDETRVRQLAEAGLWSLCVSLDHPDPAEHDRMRGEPGAFDRALETIRLARKHKIYAMAGAVATRRVVDDSLLQALWQTARDAGAQELRFVEPMPCGKLAGTLDDVLLTPDHVAKLRRFHVETNRRAKLPKVCAFNQIESPELFGCGAGTQHLFIDSAGNVCPCDFTPMSFGNATTDPLADIWARMNAAFKNPRRHCFLQCHHDLIDRHACGCYPTPPETSERICAEAGTEDLPDYFQLVTGSRS